MAYRYVCPSIKKLIFFFSREDAHQIKVGLSDHDVFKCWSFFAVFDGHAGNHVALHSAENLLGYLLDTQEFKDVRKPYTTLLSVCLVDCRVGCNRGSCE